MKMVFMGTPEFARRPLEYLHQNSRHEILAVVTGQDKKSGRGRKLLPTPVKESALYFNLPILTPELLKDDSFVNDLAEFKADIFVVVAFRILPRKIFEMPPQGSINLHGSLLPKYRGAAPIQWAIINGETETGLTTFFLKRKVDTGNMIYQEKIIINPDDTFDDLALRMSQSAGPVIEKTLDMIESDSYELIQQDDSLATPAPKIMPDDCRIDWSSKSESIVNHIRGLSSIPGAFTCFRGKKVKIFRASISEIDFQSDFKPGRIIPDRHRLLIRGADGVVEIGDLLVQGKSRMTGKEFLQGYQPSSNDTFTADGTEKTTQ